MKKGHISSHFIGWGWKRLSAVEIDPNTSNQHEFAGGKFIRLFGEQKQNFQARFVYLGTEEDDTQTDTGALTFYDSREHVYHRSSEWRFYYTSNSVIEKAQEGDLLIIAKCSDSTLLVVITQDSSTYENQIKWLFGIEEHQPNLFEVREVEEKSDKELQFASRLILDMIGIEAFETDDNYLESMIKQFDGKFPTTREFSAFARYTYKDPLSGERVDNVLMIWLEREEMLFRTLEKHIVLKRLQKGFGDDVDAFVEFSLSVQNRRKARAGYALENHLEQIFKDLDIQYSRGKITERKSRPDFIFPGIKHYHDDKFSTARLTMLGAKSTCKDRWRQILAEAERIDHKHLLTLEPGISEYQTNEMKTRNVQLVVPADIQNTYHPDQQKWLINVENFIDLLINRQKDI